MVKDLAGIEEFAHLLARAVRQFRTYPPTNPLCAEAIEVCHKALAARAERERILFRVHPRELIVDDHAMGRGTIVEQELARRLHRAHIATLAVECTASSRDLSRFCCELIAYYERPAQGTTLAELLAERGVDRIIPTMARPPEVLEIGAPAEERRELVQQERDRRADAAAAPAAVAHLYPPDRGWIRLDPTVPFAAVTLSDLAILADSPGDLAAMLLRLTGDESGDASSPQAALQQKFSDVATLFASLDPRLARLMFNRLAGAVLALDAERRTELLQRTILPGLLDGRIDGSVLRDFPDADLAESLCLLLDLETAAPEVLSAALDRLDLPANRKAAVVPLLDERLEAREAAVAGRTSAEEGIDRYTQKLVQVHPARGAAFAEFSAFDLSMDAEAEDVLAGVRDRIRSTDVLAARLECLANLVRLEPNPSLVDTLLGRALPLVGVLERADRWRELAWWFTRYREVGETVRGSRPDVADGIAAALVGFCTPARMTRLCERYERDAEGRADAAAVVQAIGPDAGAACIALLESSPPAPVQRALTQLMCDHAAVLAPVLVSGLDHCSAPTIRLVVRTLGHAGAGYGQAIADQLGHQDEQTVREALRALARIGSGSAAGLVAARIVEGPAWVRPAAEEALWHFPPEQGNAQVCRLLGERDFVRRHPQAAARLLDRAARTHADGLRPVLPALASLRFHVWNPPLARVGLKARRLLAS